MKRGMEEVLSCPGRFRASPVTDSEIPTLLNVFSCSTELYLGIFLDFTFKYRDQSLEFGLLDFGGLSVCTGALRHNQYFTGYTKSVLLLHQHTMLKIVYVSHLGFLYSVVH